MTDDRNRNTDREIERDLRAFRTASDEDRPTLQSTAQWLRTAASGNAPRPTRESFWMQSKHWLRARPWLTTAAATLAVLAILFVIPFSYERTVGHDVVLTLSGPAPDREALGKIAHELEAALGTRDIRVEADAGPGPETTTLVARVGAHSGRVVAATASAFARELASRGIQAEASVRPRMERVSANVYAMAMNRVVELRIERTGRSAAEIESDVRAQLEAAGIQNPQVQVTQEDGQTKIQIQSHENTPAGEREFKVQLQSDGTDPIHERMHQFHVERKPGMTDADVKAEIERQMREAGLQGEVTVENGQVQVKVHKHQ